jgi:fructan beta-fructosidase
MGVSGFEGKGLVNSFASGDQTTGVLTSPEFAIDRRFMNFLIGGGAHPRETCMNLIVDGKTVRTAAGPNDRPGGSEQLDWHTWDLADLEGKKAKLEIVDRHTGGWGHINIDQITLSDQKRASEPARREFAELAAYLHLPVKTGAPMRRMRFVQNGAVVREFEIELADGEPDFWVFSDVRQFAGSPLAIEVGRLPPSSKALESIAASDERPAGAGDYSEERRPQFHFTSQRGWLNDPNGLVFANCEYHLYYQHNPYGWNWGNMHWGHAVSKDLVHWTELPEALYPREFGDWCFSGSAIRDAGDVLGLAGDGKQTSTIAAFFTSTGRGECLVYSRDGGRTFTEFEGNPIVEHKGRDPKVIWHEPSQRFCMAVYDEEAGQQIAFYSSPDLKTWRFESRIDGFFECPDIFPLNIDGDAARQKWVLYAADGKYVLGQFDGKAFTPQTEKLELWRGDFYAAQTFSDLPQGRRVQIGWGRGITFPGQPFNQQMTVACELSLKTTEAGARMHALPVRELAGLREASSKFNDATLSASENPLAELRGDLWDIEAELSESDDGLARFDLLGGVVEYDFAMGMLRCQDVVAPLAPINGVVRLRILVDRGSIEVFGNDGLVAVSKGFTPKQSEPPLGLSAPRGKAVAKRLEVHSLKSIWNRKPAP